jgi:hypothetical protein
VGLTRWIGETSGNEEDSDKQQVTGAVDSATTSDSEIVRSSADRARRFGARMLLKVVQQFVTEWFGHTFAYVSSARSDGSWAPKPVQVFETESAPGQ